MVGQFQHLIDDDVRAIAALSTAERIQFLDKERDYNLPYAQALMSVLGRLKDTDPGNIRPPCRLVVGRSGMAKSYILNEFELMNPRVQDKRTMTNITPVLRVEVPNSPTPDALMHAVLHKLGAPIPAMKRIRLQYHCVRLLRAASVRLLIFDEVNRIEHVTDPIAAAVCETLKWFCNELRIPVVAAGTPVLTRYFQADEQLASRFLPYDIPTWQNDENFHVAVSTILAHMPMREPPDDEIFTFQGGAAILKVAGDTTNRIIRHLKWIAEDRLLAGEERLTLRDIASAK